MKKTSKTLKFKNGIKWVYDDFSKFDGTDIITGFYALKNNMLDAFDTPESQLVLEAIRRSTIQLDDDSDISEIRDYVGEYKGERLDGLINNVKGIYHELLYEMMEDMDGDLIDAELFEDTNHPDSDVILINRLTGKREYVQLKATDDLTYVNDAIEKNPDIRVIATEEVAQKLGIDSTGMTNEELNDQVEDVLEDLDDPDSLFDNIPDMALWTLVLMIVSVVNKMVRKEITRDQAIRTIVKMTGMKVIRVVVLVSLLSMPLTAMPVSVYLMTKYSVMVYKTLFEKRA